MSRKQHALTCAEYVFSQSEYEACVQDADNSFSDGNDRVNTRAMLKNTAYYSSCVLILGRGEANKKLTSIMLEARPRGTV